MSFECNAIFSNEVSPLDAKAPPNMLVTGGQIQVWEFAFFTTSPPKIEFQQHVIFKIVLLEGHKVHCP
jgi:hypothetical protein